MTRSNSKMTTNQCAIAGEFVDEVVDNGALEESDPQSKPVVTKCPLFACASQTWVKGPVTSTCGHEKRRLVN